MYIFLAAFSVFFIAETTVHAAAPILENSNLLKIVPMSDGVQGENLINNPTFARSAKDKNPPGWYVFVNRYDMQYVSQPVEAQYPFENVNQKVCSLLKLTNNTGRGAWAYGNTGINAMITDSGLTYAGNFVGTVKGGSYSDVYAYFLNTEKAKSDMGITLLLAQTVSVKSGSTYRFGMRSWANNGVDVGHRRYVVIYPNKFVSGPNGSPGAYYGGQEIADMFSTYTVPDGVTEITVSIRLALPAGQKEVYGDIRGLYLEEIDDDGSTGPETGAGTVQPVKVEYYKDGTLDTETELSDGMLGQGYTVPEKDYGNNYVFDYAMVNGEKVDSLPVRGYFSTSEQTVKMYYKKDTTEDEKWLPDFPDRWKNSMTEPIPKQNAFVMMEMADTEIVDYDLPLVDGKPIKAFSNETYQIHLDAGKTSWIKFKNVGFYNGKNIGVKVSVTPEKDNKTNGMEKYAYIGYTGHYFLNVAVTKDMSSAEVQYDFFDSETGEPVNISSYWTIFNLNTAKTFTINLDEFDEVYSVDRQYEENDVAKPIEIKYEQTADSLTLMGTKEKVENDQIIQGSATFTLKDTDHFKYKMTSTAENSYNNLQIAYDAQTEAFVEIPDPVGETQAFDTITADNYPDETGNIEDPLNYQFYQYVPYESKRNRGRAIEWTLPKEMNGSVIENGEWVVKDEANQIVSDRFTFEDGKMVPKDGQDESFYNHYYFFQKNLVIDDQKPIDETDLLAKDDQGRRYFDYTGEVILNTDGLAPVSSEIHSKINFAAEAEFEPVYRDEEDNDTIKPIPESSTQTERDLLITHNYQEVTPPAIDGYEYADESIPANYAELPVRYTQAEDNKVQLLYVINGELFFDIPEEMNFQKVSIPTIFKKTEYLQTIDPDWAIKVTDERSAKQRTPWKLSAQIADQSFYTHTDSEYQSQKADSEYEENIPLMSNILCFANADGATNDLTQSVVIYDSGDEPQAYDEYPIQWTDKNTGFFLDLQAFGYYPEGKYRATIDFTVEYVE